MPQPCRPMRDAVHAVVVGAGILAAGCASLRDHGMTAEIPPAPLRLVSASDVELPRDCQVRGGAVYRTNFVVHGDGRIADIQPEPAPACLQAALAEWLHGVEFAPPGEAVVTQIDWMSVSAGHRH
jgi:hypothetical protein